MTRPPKFVQVLIIYIREFYNSCESHWVSGESLLYACLDTFLTTYLIKVENK